MSKSSNVYRMYIKLQKFLFRGKDQSKWFVISLIVLILLPIPIHFLPEYKRIIFELSLTLVVFTGVQLISDTFRHFLVGLILGILAIIFIWLNFFNYDSMIITIIRPIVITAFLLYLGYYLVNFIKRSKAIDMNTIFAAVAGYLLLGIFGGQLCNLLYLVLPNSFDISGENQLYILTYFSFTTLTSSGFGDILPMTQPARSISLLLALTGQLYLTILVAILVGKYLIHKNT